jgi:hypothetical protein
MAATAFAPEASAIPAFARQTGMACVACHFIKYPTLNEFGRAFKASGYTLMGAQGRIEGEHLSIPDTLNGAILMKYRYVKDRTNGAPRAIDLADMGAGGRTGTVPGKTQGADGPTGTADGQWQFGDEISLFFGGRIAETDNFTIGFLNENNIAAGKIAGLRIPVTTDLGVTKVSIVPFTTDALGVAYGFELSSGGIMRANRWAEARREVGAVQYNADQGDDAGSASGTAFVLHNDMGFINLTKWSSSFAPGANGQSQESTNYTQNYIRAAVTPTIGDFAIVAGVGKESGTSYSNVAGGKAESNQTFFDFQAQGAIADMEAGFYAQHAKAPACTNVAAGFCAHNGGTKERSATTIGGEIAVIPHTLSLGAAYRAAKNGSNNAATGNSHTDNALTLIAVYDLAQNVALHLNVIKYSGTNAQLPGRATGRVLGMLEAAW